MDYTTGTSCPALPRLREERVSNTRKKATSNGSYVLGYWCGSMVPFRGTALCCCLVLLGWVSGLRDVGEGGLSPMVGKLSGLPFKTSSSVGDEVLLPQRTALGPLVHSAGGSSWLLWPGLVKTLSV